MAPSITRTLAQGLAAYYAANPGLKRGAWLSPEAREFFHCHDVVHVVYGCGTSMPEEAVVKLSSIFGTTAGFAVLTGYRLHESMDIYPRLPVTDTALALVLSPYLLVRTLWRCARQTRRWPWRDHDHLHDLSLAELRARYGIRVGHAASP